MQTLSVIVPVFNSEQTLARLVDRTLPVMRELGSDHELILVNDGSSDGSWQAIEALAARHPEVRGIDLMRNYGQHNALLCGIREAHHEVIVTMDDDLQNPPEEIPKLISHLGGGFDVVYGSPDSGHAGLSRSIASWSVRRVLRSLIGAEAARHISAFRAFHTYLRDAFAGYTGSYVSIDVLLNWGAKMTGFVKVKHESRHAGASNYTVSKLLNHAVDLLTGFSGLPLRLATVIGFALSLFGIGVFVYVVVRYLQLGGSVPGFPFLASIISIFSGAQLFTLGIIGEYLARVHFRVMSQPTFAVRGRCGSFEAAVAANRTGSEEVPRKVDLS